MPSGAFANGVSRNAHQTFSTQPPIAARKNRSDFDARPNSLTVALASKAPCGVMIARDDLAIEVGWERMAEAPLSPTTSTTGTPLTRTGGWPVVLFSPGFGVERALYMVSAKAWTRESGFAEARKRPVLEIVDRVGETGDLQIAVEDGAAHGALATTTPGDTAMASLTEVDALMLGAGARVRR